MRLAVYTDYAYERSGDGIYAERAFALFLGELSSRIERMTVVGRLRPGGGKPRYRLPDGVSFVALPWYESLARPAAALTAMARSLGRLWRSLDEVDGVWLLGPHPLGLAFAAVAALRGRRVALGVRQDLPRYTRARHPGRRSLSLVASALDGSYRLLARLCPTVVVGPDLARRYARARRLAQIDVSLVRERDVLDLDSAPERRYDGPLTILSVGRLEREKNPLLLAEVLARLNAGEREWRLVVCGEGELSDALAADLRERGLEERSQLRGYVPHRELRELYRESHFLLHSSWTEGFPQVVVEALAAATPIVASDVGGIRAAVGDAVALVPAGDAGAAAQALDELAEDEAERARMRAAGIAYARAHTLEHEADRLARFLAGETSSAATLHSRGGESLGSTAR